MRSPEATRRGLARCETRRRGFENATGNVTGIKSRFVSLIGGTLPSPDPFTATLVPEVTKYCK